MTAVEIARQAELLAPEDKLYLIAHLADKARRTYRRTPPRRKWHDICGAAPYPLTGEDAQAWVWGQVDVDTNLLAVGPCSVRVRVFTPDGGSQETAGLAIGYPTNQISWQIAESVSVGLRAVRAYLEGTATNRSAIRHVSLRAGTNGPVSLEIH